jgi:hypothetical protein
MDVDTSMLNLPSLNSLIVYQSQLRSTAKSTTRPTYPLLLLLIETLVNFLLALRLADKLGRAQDRRMVIQHVLSLVSHCKTKTTRFKRLTTTSRTQSRNEQNTMARVSFLVPCTFSSSSA